MTNPTLDDAQIREAAYLLWLDEGQPQGRDQEHWLRAIDALTPAAPKAKRTRKAPAKPRAAKPKAAAPAAAKTARAKTAPVAAKDAKTKASSTARKPRATKATRAATTKDA